MNPTRSAHLLMAALAACGASASDRSPDATVDGRATGDAASAIDSSPGAGDTTSELTAEMCLRRMFPGISSSPIDYDQFHPVMGSHCAGTNHQAIEGVERVVFLGDSITVGTPPTDPRDSYRARLADALAARFGLAPPDDLWKTPNPLSGEAIVAESGDFAVCAKWGARTDDLIEDHRQIEDCIPEARRGRRHLVILTVGGNDIASITEDGAAGVAVDALWLETQAFVARMREAAEWFRAEGRFPNGVYVVFANLYEFTDATGDVVSCPGAAVAGYAPWDDPAAQREMVIWANEQYLSIAVDTSSDMVFMLEQFCGHGFHHEDPASVCYRGPGTPRWFDDTCIHPNPTGHAATAQMFEQVVAE